MKVTKIHIDPACEGVKKKLKENSTVLFSMKVLLVDRGGLGLSFDCDGSTAEAFDFFMPKGWLVRFMEKVADAISKNKKMYKLMRDGTNEIVSSFDRERPDLKMKEDEACVDQQGN